MGILQRHRTGFDDSERWGKWRNLCEPHSAPTFGCERRRVWDSGGSLRSDHGGVTGILQALAEGCSNRVGGAQGPGSRPVDRRTDGFGVVLWPIGETNMTFLKFIAWVLSGTAISTAILGGVIKGLQVVQTRSSTPAATVK